MAKSKLQLVTAFESVHFKMSGNNKTETREEVREVIQSQDFRRLCEDLVFEMMDQHDRMENVMETFKAHAKAFPLAVGGFFQALGVSAALNTPRQEKWLGMAHQYVNFYNEIDVPYFSDFILHGFQISFPEGESTADFPCEKNIIDRLMEQRDFESHKLLGFKGKEALVEPVMAREASTVKNEKNDLSL